MSLNHFAGALVVVAMPLAASAETHKFKPTAGVQTFAVRPPVLTIRPGDTVETETFSRAADYYDPQKAGPWPGEVGPFLIEGAAPGDTLVVRILKLQNRDVAISELRGHCEVSEEVPACPAVSENAAEARPHGQPKFSVDRGPSVSSERGESKGNCGIRIRCRSVARQ